MRGRTHLRTVVPATARELLGPAEGQYVINGMLGTTLNQLEDAGMDVYQFTSTVPASGVCFAIDWGVASGRGVHALLYNTDCGGFFVEDEDFGTGHLGGCFADPLPAGTYEVRLYNANDQGSELSFPYTLTIDIPVPYTWEQVGDEVQPEDNTPCP